MPETPLPLPATRLFGRDDELRMVAVLLDDSRLVTLTGAGGCGKTRLALTVADQQADTYDGTVWVDLAALSDPGLVPKAVGAALHLADRPGAEPVDWLISAIADGALLLGLDNCEHLVDACADLVSRLLRDCPRLTVLATSREPLGVDGETTYRVPSLAVPTPVATDVLAFAAVALFADRATLAKPGFEVTDDNAAAVGEICRQLDGIPLAIELAAARVRMMTPAQIAAGLSDRFHLLTGGRRTALPRQRTLEASVAWSYDLLTDQEAWVLRRLSVFAGDFGLNSALQLCMSGPGHPLTVLGTLVERSLIHVDDSRAEATYRLLETVRIYALSKLYEAGEATDARDRHLDVCVQLATESEPALLSADVVARLDAIDAEVHNLRAAMEWAMASERPEKALEIAGALWLYWFIRARHDEALTRLRSLLDATPDAEPKLRYKVLMAALLLLLTTDWRAARALSEEALQIADAADDDGMRAQAYAWLGQADFQLGRPGGIELLRESLRIARATGDPVHLGRSLQWLGTALALSGHPQEGCALLDESIEMFRAVGSLQLGWTLVWRGTACQFSGDLHGAEAFLREGYAMLVARQENAFAPVALAELAYGATMRGELTQAHALLTQARETARLSVNPMAEGHIDSIAAILAVAEGNDKLALQLATQAIQTHASAGSMVTVGMCLSLRGLVLLRLGDHAQARTDLEQMVADDYGSGHAAARAQWALAQLEEAEGNHGRALDHAHDGLRAAEQVHETMVITDYLDLLGRLLVDDDPTVSARLLGASARAAADLGYVPFSAWESSEQAVRRLRESLGEEYDATYAEGKRMTIEEAVAYATRGRGPRQRASVGWDSLTPMERDVAALVAKGMSNPDIAAQLFISRNTVKAHLAHAYAKLGVANRSELAAEVSRRELTQGAAKA